MERKLLVVLFSILVAGTLFAAPVPITMWMGSWWADQAPKIMAEYAKANPNVALTIETFPINGYYDKAVATILGGNPPEIIDMDAFMIASSAGKDLLQPWDAYIKNLDTKDFAGAIWNAGVLNGKVYAIPNRGSSIVLYYNKTMFDKAGVPYPTENWTYDDMLAMAKKLTIPGQQYGLGIAGSLSDPANVMMNFASMLWAFGGDFLDKTNKTCLLNSPAAVKTITFWSELYTKYKVVPEGTPNYTVSKDIAPMFINNKVAMVCNASQAIDQFKAQKDLRWGLQVLPQKVNLGGGYAFTIPVGAAHPAEARDFVLWFVQPDNLSRLMIREPARPSATGSPPWNSPEFKIVFNASKYSKGQPNVPQWIDMQTIIITELQKVLQQTKTPQQAADDITAQSNALLRK
jgi:multiple sugar transport system substrate-binding protein